MKNFIDEDGVYHNLENLSLRQIYNDGWFSGYETGLGIGIEELEKLKVKVIALSYDCKIATIDRYEVEKLIDRQIAELKGEQE